MTAPPPPVPGRSSPALVARRLWQASRRLAISIALAGGVAGGLTLLAILAGFDYLVHCGFLLRFLLWLALVAGTGLTVRKLRRRYPPLADVSAAALVVERTRPELRELFLTGVEADLGKADGDPLLLTQVIAQARERVGREALQSLDRSVQTRCYRILYALCAVWLLGLCVAPEAVWRHGSRVLIPVARIDPYFQTKLRVIPGDDSVIKGDSVTIQVVATGELLPDFAEIELVQGDAPPTRLSMTARGLSEAERRFEFTLYHLVQDVSYRIAAGDAITYPYLIRVLEAPAIETMAATIVPPAYSQATPETIAEPAELTLLIGGGLTIEATATIPLASAALGIHTSTRTETVPMTVDGKTATGSLFSETSAGADSGVVVLLLTGTNGVTAIGRIVPLWIVPDPPPEVIIEWPGTEIKSFPSEEIPFIIRVRDNLAVTEARIGVGVGAETETVWRQIELRRQREDTAAFVLPLEEFALEVGDIVSVRVEGRDENPLPGAASQTVLIEIIPYEKFYRYDPNPSNRPNLDQVMVKLAEFIAREKKIILDTVAALGKGPAALADPASAQRLLSQDVGSNIELIRELLKQESAGGAEIMVALESARAAMDRAVSGLEAGDGPGGYTAEREALDKLQKAFRALLTIIRPANTQASGMVLPDEEIPPVPLPNRQYQDTATRNADRQQRDQETRQLLDQARQGMEQMQQMMGGQGSADRQLAGAVEKFAELLAAKGDPQSAGALKRQAERLRQAGNERARQEALSGMINDLNKVNRARPGTEEGQRAGELAEQARRLQQGQQGQQGQQNQPGQGQGQSAGAPQNGGTGAPGDAGRGGAEREELARQTEELARQLGERGDQQGEAGLRQAAERLRQAGDQGERQGALGEMIRQLESARQSHPGTAEGQRAGELADRARQLQQEEGSGAQSGREGESDLSPAEREALARQAESLADQAAAAGDQAGGDRLRQAAGQLRQGGGRGGQQQALADMEREGERMAQDRTRPGLNRPGQELAARARGARQRMGNQGANGQNQPSGNPSDQQQTERNLDNLEAGARRLAQRLNRDGDPQRADQLNRLAREMRSNRTGRQGEQATSMGDRYGTGNGRIVGVLADLIELLTKLHEEDLAADAAREALRQLETDPDQVPPELRDLVRRYFELLRESPRGGSESR